MVPIKQICSSAVCRLSFLEHHGQPAVKLLPGVRSRLAGNRWNMLSLRRWLILTS